MEGQKVLVNPAAAGDKKDGKVEIVHRYLVMQMYLASGDSFSIELQVRDKQNVRRKFLIFMRFILISVESKKTYVY